MRRQNILALITLASATFASFAASPLGYCAQPPSTRPSKPPATLHVGDSAPPLHVARWLKGSPSPSLTDGRVHVVEFWASWCGWCVIGMPHLSEMAKKYGDRVCVMSINVWEDSHDADAKGGFHGADPTIDKTTRAEAFVQRAGDMMAYNVALDDAAETMGTTWGKAAAIPGLPTAFVLDGQGKIAWIGSPGDGMEEVIDALLSGNFSPATAKAIEDEWTAKGKKYGALSRTLDQAFKNGKYTEALIITQELLDASPTMVAQCCEAKYAALTHTDPPAAAAFGQDVMKTYANAPLTLSGLGMSIVSDTRVYPIAGDPDRALAIRLLNQSFVCMAPRWPAEQALASAYFATGDVDDAVRLQASAVQKMANLFAKVPAMAKFQSESRQKLDQYRLAAATAH